MPLLLEAQRSAEWFAARAGKITASLAAACLGLDPHKGPLAAFNEITKDKHQAENKHMAWGREFEATARDAYECESGYLVAPTGFWSHPVLEWLGASPDGLCNAEGLVEIKCPTALPDAIPVHHEIQMRVQMACTERLWCDYFVWTHDGHFLKRLELSRDAEFELLDNLKTFYTRHILTGEAPPRRRKGAA